MDRKKIAQHRKLVLERLDRKINNRPEEIRMLQFSAETLNKYQGLLGQAALEAKGRELKFELMGLKDDITRAWNEAKITHV